MSKEVKQDVHACVRAVMKLLGTTGISKDSVNEQQRFQFRGIDDALNALNGPLVAAGLVIYPTVRSVERTERTTKSGNSMTNTLLVVDYRLVSTHDGSETTVTFAGEASDSGDKGVSKALSMSLKYALFQTFCIPVQGMDDSDATTPPPSLPLKKAGKAPGSPQAARKEAPAGEVAPGENEGPEAVQEPETETTYTFDQAMADLAAVGSNEDLAALRPKLAGFAKHKSFAKMKALFAEVTAKFAPAVEEKS